ncbi:MAG: hypothetical protein AAFO95_05415 [Cyanobacteria bacterium J06600_6]
MSNYQETIKSLTAELGTLDLNQSDIQDKIASVSGEIDSWKEKLRENDDAVVNASVDQLNNDKFLINLDREKTSIKANLSRLNLLLKRYKEADTRISEDINIKHSQIRAVESDERFDKLEALVNEQELARKDYVSKYKEMNDYLMTTWKHTDRFSEYSTFGSQFLKLPILHKFGKKFLAGLNQKNLEALKAKYSK